MIAVKNHHHAMTNPKAQLRQEITVEQVLNAPMVVEPFGLYDCTPQSDGAAALLVVGEEVVDRYTDQPVWVRGFGLGLDRVMHQHKVGHDDLPRRHQGSQGGVRHGRARAGRHRRGRGPRLLHRRGAHLLRGPGICRDDSTATSWWRPATRASVAGSRSTRAGD